MTDQRSADTVPLNAPDVDPGAKREQLEGTSSRGNQEAAFAEAEVDGRGGTSDTELYEGEPDLGGGVVSLDELTDGELREGETDNPDVAAEEGEAWVPPIDPPVIADADSPDGMTIAAGFGSSASEEPFDEDHHPSALPGDDEVTARVREALLADSRTSRLADGLRVQTAGGIVRVRGEVADIDDGDLVAEVVSEVPGVTEVRDETVVPGL